MSSYYLDLPLDAASSSEVGRSRWAAWGFGGERGMTLIEIMIVMAIIGSLLAVLGTTAKTQWEKSKVSNAKIQIGELSKAIDAYSLDCNTAPPTLEALVANPGTDVCPNWGPNPYTKKKNLNDPWGTPFVYEVGGAGGYKIVSYGSDRKPDGDGNGKDLSNEE